VSSTIEFSELGGFIKFETIGQSGGAKEDRRIDQNGPETSELPCRRKDREGSRLEY